MNCSLNISDFLEEISSVSHSILFLYFFALISKEGFLFSPCNSLELYIQIGISFLFSFDLVSLLFSALCKATSDSHFSPLHFFFIGDDLITASCTMSRTSVHSSSGTLSIRSSPLSLFVTSTVLSYGILFRSCLNGLLAFPIFFNLSLNFVIRSLWAEPQLAPSIVFATCIELLHIWLQRI